jgi:hypothetical protein
LIVQPLIGDAHSADERDIAVDDQRLAVRTVIRFFDLEADDRVHPFDLGASRLEAILVVAGHLLRAYRIEHDAHAYAAFCRSLERIGEHRADVAFFVNVGLERDSLLGAIDRGEHGRKRLLAIGKNDVRIV